MDDKAGRNLDSKELYWKVNDDGIQVATMKDKESGLTFTCYADSKNPHYRYATLVALSDETPNEPVYEDGTLRIPETVALGVDHFRVRKIDALEEPGYPIKKIEIPEGVHAIAPSAFKGFRHLEEIIYPCGSHAIRKDTFKGCTALRKLTVYGSVTLIEKDAFRGCSSLREVEILDTAHVIEEDAFSGCTSYRGPRTGEGFRQRQKGRK